MNKLITWNDFAKIDIRIGTIIQAEIFNEAKKIAYKLQIDFGDLGIKKSSAQLTKLYSSYDLIGKQVVAVMNFPSKQIATMMSECLVLGAIDIDNTVVLLQPERPIKNGIRIG